MSCLLDNDSRRALRVKIATDFREKMQSDQPFDINKYIQEIYVMFKDATEDELLAVDAARLVPTLALQIINNDQEIKSGLRKKDPKIGSNLDGLEIRYENIEELRKDLGLNESPAEVVIAVQQQMDKVVEQRTQEKKEPVVYNPIPYGAFRSFGVEMTNYTDPTKPGYMEPKADMVHQFTVMRALDNALMEQMTSGNISDSSQMTYPGVPGGIFLQIKGAPYRGMVMTLVDNSGQAIKFDQKGNVDINGTSVEYPIVTDPLRDSNGDIITETAEFESALAKITNTGAKTSYKAAFKNIKANIEAQIAYKNPEGKNLSPDQLAAARKEAIKVIKDQFALQKEMRDYVNDNAGAFIMGAINGGSKGFINQNIFSKTPLAQIDFSQTGFTPFIETKDQVEGSSVTSGTLFFKIPGLEIPLAAIGEELVNRPELLDKIVGLFTGDIWSSATGKPIRLSIAERNKLIGQYLFTREVKFNSNDAGGGARNWLNSDGTFTIQIGIEEKRIKFDGSPEAEAMQKEAAETLKAFLSKPFIQADEKGFPLTNNFNSNSKLTAAEEQGAKIYRAAEGETFEQAVASGKITPGTIFVITKPNLKGGNRQTDVDRAFQVFFPTVNASNEYLNKQFPDVNFTQEDGKQVVTTTDRAYNDYIKENFKTSAKTVDNKIQNVNPFMSFTPLVSQLSKLTVPKAKAVEPTAINEIYKGKIIYATPGTGKTTVAQTTENVVDVDDLLLQEIGKLVPEFFNRGDVMNATPQEKIFAWVKSAKEYGFEWEIIYNNVRPVMTELANQGKTLLTGSTRLMDMTDYIFLQTDLNKVRNKFPQGRETNTLEEFRNRGQLKAQVISNANYMNETLSVAPVQVAKLNAEHKQQQVEEKKKAEEQKQENKPLTQKTVSSMSPAELLKALQEKKIQKGSQAKASEVRATAEHLKAAEEWWSNPTNPLRVIPFKIMFAAVNASGGNPAADFAVTGITLYHYYSADGTFNEAISGNYTDLYHEAWHAFTQTFLTPEQRKAMYAEMRKRSGSFIDFKGRHQTYANANWEQLEEQMAEEFRAYAMSGGKLKFKAAPVQNSIFRMILDFLKNLFGKATATDVIQNPLGVSSIQELYQKMYVGDLSAYNFDVNNRDKTIGAMQHAVLAINETDETPQLSSDDAVLMRNSIDSLLSKQINELNKTRGDAGMTTELMNPENMALGYALVKHQLEMIILPRLRADLLTAKNEFEKNRIEQDIKLIEWSIKNFGDYDNLKATIRSGKSLIAYHFEQSDYLTDDEREALTDDDINETKQNLAASDLHSQSGNEKSLLEMASPDIFKMLRSVHKYGEDNQPVLNRLGIHELADHYHMSNKLARVLNDTLDQNKMYEKLKEAAFKDGVTIDESIAEVLVKLGPPVTTSNTSKRLWINFWSTFNMANIKLVQMNIKNNGKSYDLTIGSASSHANKVGFLWNNIFRSMPKSKFIKRNQDESSTYWGNNYLDVSSLLKEFTENGKFKKGSEFDFFRALGVHLSDKPAVRKALTREGGNTGSATQIFARLKRIVDERGTTQIYSLNDVFKEYPAENGFDSIINENSNFNDLKELETRNSDYANNYMVTNASGDTQFEQSLHNTISIMVTTMNEVESFAQLMELPHMRYLNPANNSFAAASIWLNSLFDMDTYMAGGEGKKRTTGGENPKPIRINMSNLSGITLIEEAGDQGVSSASSDEFSKMIMDFHMLLKAGKPELMRHADKSTSFSIWLDQITGGSTDNKQYANIVDFIKDQDGNVRGYGQVNKILERYINAELLRINRLKNLSELAKDGKLEYDANYLEQGQEFIIFEKILDKPTKEALLKLDSLYVSDKNGNRVYADPELMNGIKQQIVKYFDGQTEEVTALMNKASDKPFIDAALVETTRIKANQAGVSTKTINNEATREGLTRAFVVNSWIHNLESMSMIYGDLAQYNLAKEEFHKRNAGAGSTGKLFASDADSIDYVNSKSRKYAASREGFLVKKLDRMGSFDSAVLADNEIPSVYYNTLFKAIKEELKRKNPKTSEEELTKKATTAADAYTKNNEGDAQGWITFDFYRTLSILEGKWSDPQEHMYNDIIKGVPVDATKVTEFFPTRKFQYWGYVETAEGTPPLNAFHKFSLMPMVPSIVGDTGIYKDRLTNLGLLHEKMINQGVDYAMFKSGSKISTITKISPQGKTIQDKFYSNGEEHTFEEKGEFTKNKVFLQFLKDQLDIAPYFKEQVTFPTQMRKLIENGLMEGGVPTDFMKGNTLVVRQKAWNRLTEDEKLKSDKYKLILQYEKDIEDLTELRKKELEKEANILRDADGNILMNEKLAKFLVNELKRQDLGEHEIDFLRQIDGKLSKDLSISLSAEKMEKALNSIVVRRLIKQKFNGEALVQVSGAGFESPLRGKLTDEEKLKYGTNGLTFYQRGTDGKTMAMKVKIALQGDFLNLLHLKHTDGKVIGTRERLNEMLKNEAWLNTGDHRKMISIIGPRIPVQGLNSMEFAEVFEFLPIEAGNIVVLPTEIVAKAGGDFDIDKLTFLYPNISSGVDFEFWKTEAGKKKLNQIRTDNAEQAELLTDVNVETAIENRKSKDKTPLDKQILEILASQGERKVSYVTGKSAEGLQNKILENMRSILELNENFADLIRPNGTDIVKEGLADEIADLTMDFDPRTVEYTDKKGKKSKRIAGTTVFETRYNLYKHASNNIGKQTLGLGAVDNTYNSLFNRIGARMNHDYITRGVEKRLHIMLQHNSLQDEKGRDVISLSHLMDAKGENSISDVISQLMNGWVDIAKDAWIFNIQGNKEVAPVLLFMIQAGVPIKQAVYMAANPMVREYVMEQKIARSTFAGPLGKSPGNWRFFRNQARKIILGNPKFGINMSDTDLTNANKLEVALNNKQMEFIGPEGSQLDFFNKDNVENNLLERMKAFKNQGKDFQYSDEDRAVFLHFIELEEMSKSLTGIKTKTNVDTSRSNTLFEAQARQEMIEDLKSDGKFPDWMITKLVGDPERGIKGESPIASFNIQGFQIKLWKDFFKLRNHAMSNRFLLEKMKEPGFRELVEETYGDSEKLASEFRNGIVPFVFQNYLRKLDLNEVIADGYKGVEVNTKVDVNVVSSLEHGVYVDQKDGKPVIYIDKTKLMKDYQTLGTKTQTAISGAKLNAAAFPTAGTYYSFVLERELLRAMYKGQTGWTLLQERADVQAKLAAYKEQMKTKSQAEIEALVYEETLRDMALDRTFNMWKLFKSQDTMADQLIRIQSLYPELAAQYAVVNNLAPSIREQGGQRTSNIMMTDIMMDADKVNLFNQNLRELSNAATLKISATNALEKQRVAEFFKSLSIYAFLQSGMKTTGPFSLVRIVPQDRFTGQMIPYSANYMEYMNPLTLQRYWNTFVHNSRDKKLRTRMRDYTIGDFNPARDKAMSRAASPEAIKKMALGSLAVSADRFGEDNDGNILYYANPGLNQEGQKINGIAQTEANTLVKDNPDVVFVMNGAIGSMAGGNSNEKALINAKVESGNVIPFPTKKSFAFTGYELTDVTAEEAGALEEVINQEEKKQKPVIGGESFNDAFRYFGTYYTIKVENGVGVDVVDATKGVDKVKMLAAYNKDKNVDPQNGKAFRGATYTSEQKVTEKKIRVPKGSKSTNKPIFETENEIFLMNDDQQAAYDHIKSFVLSKLNKTSTKEGTVKFDSPMTKEFSGIIPEAMWDNMIGLVGRGGVGKTTVIKKVLDDVQKEHKGFGGINITYGAPTHNAVTMLQEALGMDSERTGGVQTLASLVKRNQLYTSKDKEPSDTGGSEDGLFLLKKEEYEKGLKWNPAISDSDIIVIDESSMVDSQFIKDLLFRFKSERGGRMPVFIYMGDYRQLPPVQTGATEKKFREGIISATLFGEANRDKFSELSQVMRSDNEAFHKIFDTVGNQITDQRTDVEKGGTAKNFDFTEYDEKTNKSTENMLVLHQRQVDAMIDLYAEVLANTNDPYEMFWTHYNNLKNAKTQELFKKIRAKYFEMIGQPVPASNDVAIGDFVQSIFNMPVETEGDTVLGIEKGIVKPTARFKVLDIIETTLPLSRINKTLYQALGTNIEIPVKRVILHNRQGKKRIITFPSVKGTIAVTGYNAQTRSQGLTVTDKEGNKHAVSLRYGDWKENQNEILQLNKTVNDMFQPSYIGSTHTVQGASLKKIIVGDYNIRENAPHIAMRDMESSLYTALTRTAGKLIIIKPNSVAIENNQEVFEMTPPEMEGLPQTTEDAKVVAVEGAPSEEQIVYSPADYINHSGGAYGGDTFWDIIGREFGVTKHQHYREGTNVNLSQKLRSANVVATVLTKEQMDVARAEIERLLGKVYPDTTEGNLQVRNYYQVANADAVYAIASLNGDETLNMGSVFGGTNTAVQLGIKLNKPVYVWDTSSEQWFKFEMRKGEKFGDFVKTDTPTLTKNFAGVGTRDIESYNVKDKNGKWSPRKQYLGAKKEAAAKQAIKEVYEKTFKKETSVVKKSVIAPINGTTINPQVKAAIDQTIQSMIQYQQSGKELAFPGTGIGQYMIGADDLTGILPPNAIAVAPATFIYLSEQLFKNFNYVNPNYERALFDRQLKNLVQAESPVTDDQVRIAMDFFEKNCG